MVGYLSRYEEKNYNYFLTRKKMAMLNQEKKKGRKTVKVEKFDEQVVMLSTDEEEEKICDLPKSVWKMIENSCLIKEMNYFKPIVKENYTAFEVGKRVDVKDKEWKMLVWRAFFFWDEKSEKFLPGKNYRILAREIDTGESKFIKKFVSIVEE